MREIMVVEYDPRWQELFTEEAGRIRQAVGESDHRAYTEGKREFVRAVLEKATGGG